MSKIKRNCDQCKREYFADSRNLSRGWGLTCSKSCASKKRESSKPGYNPETVRKNNYKRMNWNSKEHFANRDKTRDYDSFDHPFSDDNF